MSKDCVNLIENFLNYLRESLSKIDFVDVKIEIQNPHRLTNDINQRQYSILYNILVIINEIIFRSDELKLHFSQIRMVKFLASFLERNYVNKFIFSHKKLVLLLIKIFSMSRWSDETKYEWNE
jgi:hypothetical protein